MPSTIPWSPVEDALLLHRVHEQGFQWSRFVALFPERSMASLRHRWWRIQRTYDKTTAPPRSELLSKAFSTFYPPVQPVQSVQPPEEVFVVPMVRSLKEDGTVHWWGAWAEELGMIPLAQCLDASEVPTVFMTKSCLDDLQGEGL